MMHAERKLFRYYFFSSLLFVLSIITFSVPWGHWAYTLNRCPYGNCECVLYGRSYSESFVGGTVQYCQFVTFGQIPLLLTSITLAFYHGIRAYIRPRKAARETVWRGNPLLSGSRRKAVAEKNPAELELELPTLRMTIFLVVVSLIALALLLTVFGFFVDGFFQSCREYRRTLVQYLHASGRVAYILNNRLICSSVFDFMDYLQPDRREMHQPLEFLRRERINTGMSLLLSNFSLVLNVILWIAAAFANCKLLFAKLRNPKT